MDKQQRLEALAKQITDVDVEIARTQADLQSPATSADDIPGLRANLIDLHTKRSDLQDMLINLQASATEVDPLG
jgi:hypothetical protein